MSKFFKKLQLFVAIDGVLEINKTSTRTGKFIHRQFCDSNRLSFDKNKIRLRTLTDKQILMALFHTCGLPNCELNDDLFSSSLLDNVLEAMLVQK